MLKVNFDGAWCIKGGIGFCVRDWQARIILAGAAHSDASSALVTEIIAARWEIGEVLKLHWAGPIILDGDSMTTVAWLGGESGSIMPALIDAQRLMATRGVLTTLSWWACFAYLPTWIGNK